MPSLIKSISMLAGVFAASGVLAGCVAGGNDSDDNAPACTGKCDGPSPDGGVSPDSDVPPDAAPVTGGGSVTIDGVPHAFATGNVRTGPYSSGSIWILCLDNWSYGTWGTHTEAVTIAVLKDGTQLAGTYPCGLAGPDAWKVSVDYYSGAANSLIGTDGYPNTSCSVTFNSTPTAVGDRVEFTFSATVADAHTTRVLADGSGTAILTP